MNVLLAGESWHEVSFVVKGQDVSATSTYTEAGAHLIAALETAGAEVTYQPCHVARDSFPRTRETLREYDLVVLSDIGAQTLLLTPEVSAGERSPNRLQVLADYVADGGAVGMVGGYTSFAGENGQAGYWRTPLADVLPVEVAAHDDRIERPEGVRPRNRGISALPDEWPPVLGYNRVAASDESEVLATVDGDPLLTVGDHGDGRAFAYATDCAKHWAPSEFLKWDYLPDLWEEILSQMA
jgi:uncharacterized membrane protein